MTSRCNRRAGEAGVSLLEMLVVLALIALLLGVAATRLTGPSPRLSTEALGAKFVDAAYDQRLEAMVQGREIAWAPILPNDIKSEPCSEAETAPPIVFLPTGRALGGPVCLKQGDRGLILSVDWLTGLVAAEIR